MDITLDVIPHVVVGVLYFFYWVVVFIILYHLTRFGIGTKPKKFAAIFLLGSVILFVLSLILYMNTDFSTLSQISK